MGEKQTVTEKNGVAGVLKGAAIIIFIGALLCGIFWGIYSGAIGLIRWWGVGLISGAALLGLSEIIRLLHEINQKTKA